jgi:hypothetical protein
MRVTRAALRAQAHDDSQTQLIHEDADADMLTSDPSANLDDSRPVLKDITDENYPVAEEIDLDEQKGAPLNEPKSKRSGKRSKKGEEDHTEGQAGQEQELSQDSARSDPEGTMESTSVQDDQDIASVEETVATDEAQAETVTAATPGQVAQLNATSTPYQAHHDPPKTPRFDPSIHTPEEGITTPAAAEADTAEDSFVENIKTRSPSKMQTDQEANSPPIAPVEPPARQTLRIEDSVDAMDALEDAIEKVSERIPDLDGLQIESPIKPRKNDTPLRSTARPTTRTPATTKKPAATPGTAKKMAATPAQQKARTFPTKAKSVAKPPVQLKPTTTARAPVRKPSAKAPAVAKQSKRPIIDGVKARESSTSSHPSMSFSTSPVKGQPNPMKKRVTSSLLSTSKPGFVPAKSAKPPTMPTFSLPGESISAKLKAQREERLKREEEAEKERKTFKARPVPTKTSRPSVLPRENRASQARMSIYANGINKENVAPRQSSAASRPSASAKPSGRRTTAVIEKPGPPKAPVCTLPSAADRKSSATKEGAAQPKPNGKQVFGRSKAEMERLEKERKEKEEATRKARAEAAERGRQASREWAEKQKKKLATQAAARGKVEAAPQGQTVVATS